LVTVKYLWSDMNVYEHERKKRIYHHGDILKGYSQNRKTWKPN